MSDDPQKITTNGTESQRTTTHSSSRRRVLQAVGGTAAALGFTSSVSADDNGNSDEYTPNEDQRPEGQLGNGEGISYARISDQVTDGTYAVVDEINIVPEDGAFAEIHLASPLPDLPEPADETGFINPEDGGPQFAFETTLGFSEFLPQGLHQNVTVPLFEDEELLAVDGSVDRLPQPAVLVALPHIDDNENEEFDNFREGDPDLAFGVEDDGDEVGAPNDLDFAPPSVRTTDVAAVIPVEDEESAKEFQIFRPRNDDLDHDDDDWESDGDDDDDDDDMEH